LNYDISDIKLSYLEINGQVLSKEKGGKNSNSITKIKNNYF